MLEASLVAAVSTVAGLLALLVWKAGGRFLSALVEIARLPDAVAGIDSTGAELVTELRGAIHEMRSLARRVDRLEAFLPDRVRVHADFTVTNPNEDT